LKGAGLHAIAYDNDLAQRPIDDVDVLVESANAIPLIEALQELGFRSPVKRQFWPDRFASYASANFGGPQFEQIDVHWRINHWQRDPQLQERMWQRRIPARLAEVDTSTLCRTDHLLHVIGHGATYDPSLSCRWAADAFLLIDKATSEDCIDWALFVDECQRAGFVLSSRTALRWLRSNLHAQVPLEVIHQLDALSVGPGDRLTQWVRERPPSRTTMTVRLLVVDYRVRTQGEPPVERIRRYPRYLRDTLIRDGKGANRVAFDALRGGFAERL
jgi:Uncharacterised nucleotidyltransferase